MAEQRQKINLRTSLWGVSPPPELAGKMPAPPPDGDVTRKAV
jgi:hypothetical protein